MIRIVIPAITLVLAAGVASCSGRKADEDKFRKGWTLTWEDNFEGEAGLTAWSKVPRGTKSLNRYMSDNGALCVLEDGFLVLRGVENVGDHATVPFLTGGVTRPGMERNRVCRIEVRACVTPATGAVPLIALLPRTEAEGNVSVRMMERHGSDDFVYQSVTSEYTTTGGLPDNPPSMALVGVNPDQYHVYGVETYPDSLVFFVDGNRTKKYPRVLTDIPGQYPFADMDFDLFLGVRLDRDTDPAALPANLFVDWVRYYEPALPAPEM